MTEKPITLFKLAKKLNIGISTAVEALSKVGIPSLSVISDYV